MPTRTKCHNCGTETVVCYIKILGIPDEPDGPYQAASRWLNVIECPKCGRREQPSGESAALRSMADARN